MNIIEYAAMTRPRSSSGVSTCRRVLEAAMCVIMKKPQSTSVAAESPKDRDAENATRESPKPVAATATQRPSPREPSRAARTSAAASAPTPVAPSRMPSPREPPPRTRSAKTGISTTYGMPITLTSPSSARIAATAGCARHEPPRVPDLGEGGRPRPRRRPGAPSG